MKKIAMLFAAAAVMLGLSSCEQNTNPRYNPTTVFELNTPALATQYYKLTPDGYIDLTWSQPQWGVSVAGTYKVQMSLDETFKKTGDDGQAYDWFYQIDATYNQCQAAVPMKDVAIGLCVLRNIKKEEQYVDEPAGKVYFRVVGQIAGVEGSEVTSNVITLDQVKGYMAIQSPGKIYLVGAPEGWKGPDAGNAAHYADWALYEPEDAIGSKVYSATFTIPAGQAMFRFYTALTGWDADSWGSQADDNALSFAFSNNQFKFTLVKGKGAFNFNDDWSTNGTMDINVNMNTKELIIKATR